MSLIDLIRLTKPSEKHMFSIFLEMKGYDWKHEGDDYNLFNYLCQGVLIEDSLIWIVENYDTSLMLEKKRGHEVKELGIAYMEDSIGIYKEV